MSSQITDIITFIEGKILTSLPGIKKSPFYYAINNDPELQKYDYVFAVRPGDANPTEGVTQSITKKLNFDIEIARKFKQGTINDEDAKRAVDLIYQDNEKLEAVLVKRGLSGIKKVDFSSISAPDFDDKSKIASITFTYPITFSKQISGVL